VARLNLTIDSDVGDVALLAVAVNRIARLAGFDEIAASEVELCVAEAVTNAIRHAYGGETGHWVEVRVETGKDALRLRVFDSGNSMPHTLAERLTQKSEMADPDTESRAQLAEGGRGLQIIRGLMDEVAYLRIDERNCLEMTRRLGN
jgi:serine/threonine-protein kinase RsbW